jgi:cation:H+ antiporter
MSFATILLLVVGFVCLVGGAELLVRGAAAVASRLGISPIVIGLTVVAFGTSAPELAVSVNASLGGKSDVAFGNVVGSNIANILLILGLSATAGALVVTQRIVRLDVPILIAVSLVALLMGIDRKFSRIDGIILVLAAIVYTVWLIRTSRAETKEIDAEHKEAIDILEEGVVKFPLITQILFVLGGFVFLVVGSQLLVNSATQIAESFGISELVIGLTIIAIGTSLPELATSVMASIRGERDIAVGNVIGSNLFNIMLVLGMTSVVSSNGVAVQQAALRLDIPVMIGATLVLLPICWNGFQIRRWEGFVLVGFYVLYVLYLLLDANDHSATTVAGPAVFLVASLSVLGFSVAGYQGWRRHRATVKAQQR